MWALHLASITCGIVAVFLYLNTLNGEMVFDDRAAIVENNDLRPTSQWSNLLWHDFWGDELSHKKSHKSFRPLCTATFKFNFHLHELQPLGYHVVNIVLNAVVCYFYVYLCAGVFNGDLWPTFVAGLLFTVHPIHTEAVASIVGRAELLSSLFSIIALLCYTKGISNNKSGIGWKWLLMTIVFLLCSLISKEQGITVAALCVTYELFIVIKMDLRATLRMIKTALSTPKTLPENQKLFFKRTIILMTFVLVILISRIIIMQGGPQFGRTDNPGQRMDTPYRQLYYLHLIFANSWLLINPSKLLHDYRFGVVPLVDSFLDVRHLLTILTFFCLSFLGLWLILHKSTQFRRGAFAFSVVVLTFLPASNLFFLVGFVVAERVLFLPSMGFCILVAYGAWHLKASNYRVFRYMVYVGLSIVFLSHTTKTVNRNTDWTVAYNLYISALKNNRQDGMMFSNLAYALVQNGDLELAEEAHKIAVTRAPNYSQPFRNYGALLYSQERYEEAEKMYRRAVHILGSTRVKKRSKSIETYRALARTIAKKESRVPEALEVINTALSMQADNVELNAQKVSYLLRMNRTKEAKLTAEKAISLHPNDANLLYYIGVAYMDNSYKIEAENFFKTALSVSQNTHGMAMIYAGKLLIERATTTEQVKEANMYLKSVVNANPNISDAQYGLGLCYFKVQRFKEAETRFRTALALEPTHPDALYTLSYLYYFNKNYTLAVEVLTSLPDWQMHVFNNTNAAKVLANSYIELNQTQKLKEIYEGALKQNPKDSQTIHWLDALKHKIKENGFLTV